jgi:hypothetical protein
LLQSIHNPHKSPQKTEIITRRVTQQCAHQGKDDIRPEHRDDRGAEKGEDADESVLAMDMLGDK